MLRQDSEDGQQIAARMSLFQHSQDQEDRATGPCRLGPPIGYQGSRLRQEINPMAQGAR